MITFFTMLGAAVFLVLGLMLILWVVYLFKRNSSIVDIGWAVGFILCAWAYLVIGQGDPLKKWILAIMATIWAGRLAWHLYRRYMVSEEDPRYQEIRKGWGGDANVLFLLMFILQGILVVVISTPFLIVSANGNNAWGGWEWAGMLFWIIGVAGETISDRQLTNFRQNPANTGKVCQNGFWFFSRHPNYFFEFLVWVGFALFAMATPWGWVGVISPILILILLLKVSGIPLAEAQALRTKGDQYREYQRTTSAFVPWFPKS